MAQCDSAKNLSLRRRPHGIILSFCWGMGWVCGVLLFLYAGTPGVSLMRGIAFGSVSVVSLFCIGSIPFLFTAYAVFISELRLLFLICFCKACLFSFISVGISVAFSSAGWMMRTMLLFSGSIWCVELYFLWLRLLSGRKACWFPVISVGIAAGCISYYIISPFLAGLIEI